MEESDLQHLGLSLWTGSGPEGSPGLGPVEEDAAPTLDALCVPLPPSRLHRVTACTLTLAHRGPPVPGGSELGSRSACR